MGRSQYGLTLPFALILTFIFSALVSVSYLFVSVNLNQMQSSLQSIQAIAISEGINERIKARLNTKSKIQPSPSQEEKLKSAKEEEGLDEEELDEEEEEALAEDEFNEETEEFDEYYADEILKISRFITFREPPEEEISEQSTEVQTPETQPLGLRPEANVEMIGSIEIPRGTVLNKGTKILVFKDEKIDLMLSEIVPDEKQLTKAKLPIPIIKSLSPNYSEANNKGAFVVNGQNIPYNAEARFTNKDIYVEDIKSGPTIYYFVGMDVMPGLTRFYLNSTQAEFYITPTYDSSTRPTVTEVKLSDGNQLVETKAGTRHLIIMIYGSDLYLKKNEPVAIPDAVGIIPKVKDQNDKEITVSLDIDKKAEVGVHSIAIATEGGLSNAWLFNVLPPSEKQEEYSLNTAIFSSALTLLNIRVVENLLPLIDEKEGTQQAVQEQKDKDDLGDDTDMEGKEEEISESKKLSPFANVDLETTWLLETSTMIGKITKTVSEVIHREIPNVQGAVITNGGVSFDGGGFQIAGLTTAMTKLTEPTYLSNTLLTVEGPPEEPEVPIEVQPSQARGAEAQNILKSPIELGFNVGSLVAVYKEGDRVTDLDYALVNKLDRNTIELFSPGLMDFHYEGDIAVQFNPPVISKEKVSESEDEKHTSPQGFVLSVPNAGRFSNIFKSNLDQFAELADFYTDDTNIPKDEDDLPISFMGLTYIEGTPVYDAGNVLAGKGILIIDTRGDNQGRPVGDVEFNSDSKNPIDFNGIVYIHGNAMIAGSININGALVVDNEPNRQIQITSNAVGKINYDPRSIKQTLLSVPFTTKPGTVMISSTPINLAGVVQTAAEPTTVSGEAVTTSQETAPTEVSQITKLPELPPDKALIEIDKSTQIKTIQVPSSVGGKTAEEELIDLF
ncbi:MAG: hypothetical protein HYY52_00835 [Candidatus Melainabacteria bacterium]|nr:hypothetical protein [Candidatus Melainabacteria bacterium]